jgi:hypothetical protein
VARAREGDPPAHRCILLAVATMARAVCAQTGARADCVDCADCVYRSNLLTAPTVPSVRRLHPAVRGWHARGAAWLDAPLRG